MQQKIIMLLILIILDQILIVLSATTGGVCIVSHATVVGAPVGILSAGFTTVFSLATGIITKILSTTRNKKKKHDKILILRNKS